jgi:hypothetical protein
VVFPKHDTYYLSYDQVLRISTYYWGVYPIHNLETRWVHMWIDPWESSPVPSIPTWSFKLFRMDMIYMLKLIKFSTKRYNSTQNFHKLFLFSFFWKTSKVFFIDRKSYHGWPPSKNKSFSIGHRNLLFGKILKKIFPEITDSLESKFDCNVS